MNIFKKIKEALSPTPYMVAEEDPEILDPDESEPIVLEEAEADSSEYEYHEHHLDPEDLNDVLVEWREE